jgi:hypothetical protein
MVPIHPVVLAMIIHDNFQFHPLCGIGEEIIKHFSQSEVFMAPGSHVG